MTVTQDVLAPEETLFRRADAASEYYEAVIAYLDPENQYTESRRHAMDEAERKLLAALVRTPETLDVDALVASLPAVRRRTDVHPMIPESAVRRLLTTLAAAQSPAPPEGLRADSEIERLARSHFESRRHFFKPDDSKTQDSCLECGEDWDQDFVRVSMHFTDGDG